MLPSSTRALLPGPAVRGASMPYVISETRPPFRPASPSPWLQPLAAEAAAAKHRPGLLRRLRQPSRPLPVRQLISSDCVEPRLRGASRKRSRRGRSREAEGALLPAGNRNRRLLHAAEAGTSPSGQHDPCFKVAVRVEADRLQPSGFPLWLMVPSQPSFRFQS